MISSSAFKIAKLLLVAPMDTEEMYVLTMCNECYCIVILQSGCPYFASTGLNGGWKFLVPVSEMSCSVTVTIVDFYDPFSRPLSATESCTFSSKQLWSFSQVTILLYQISLIRSYYL